MTRAELRFLMRRLLRDELHQQWPDNTRLNAELFVAMKTIAREHDSIAELPIYYETLSVGPTLNDPDNFVVGTTTGTILIQNIMVVHSFTSTTSSPGQTLRVPYERLSLYESQQTDRGDWIYSMREDVQTRKARFDFPVAHPTPQTFKWEYSVLPADFTGDGDSPILPGVAHELIAARAAMQMAVPGHPALNEIVSYYNDLHNRFVSAVKAKSGGVEIHDAGAKTVPVPDVDSRSPSNVRQPQ